MMRTQENLIQVGKQWDQAIVDNDAEKVGKFMSSDWVIVGTEGGITSKASFLDSIRSSDLVHTWMDFEDIRAKLYGNTGVVTGRGTSSGFYKGHPFSFFEWSPNVLYS